MLETAIHKSDCLKRNDFIDLFKNKELKLKETGIFNISWVGRIEEGKALIIALDALEKLSEFEFEFNIIGDGTIRDKMIRYASKMRIFKKINFIGQVPFNEVKNIVKNSNLFLFSSIQDTSGNVVLEAMSQGVPVVALNHQGVAEILSDGGGILIEVESYQKTINSFSNAIKKIISNSKTRYSLSYKALKSVTKNHCWDSRMEHVKSIYNLVSK